MKSCISNAPGPLLLATTLIAQALVAQARPEVVAIQLPKTTTVTGVHNTDVDGDGRTDLVLACGEEGSQRRQLRTHLRAERAPVYGNEPSTPPYDLEKDILGFAHADVHPAAGRELVLFTAERAVAVLGPADPPTYAPLFDHRLVWPAPGRTVLSLAFAVRDLDGDGLDDFALPEPDGARVVLQRRTGGAGAFGNALRWTLPAKKSLVPTAGDAGPVDVSGNQLGLRLALGDDSRSDAGDRGPLLQLHMRTPPLHVVDFDGNGTQDGLVLHNDRLWWWPQTLPGQFAALPTTLPLPLPEDRLPLFDPAFDVQATDIDGDRRADLLLVTSARRQDEVEVRLDLFVQRATGGPWASKPDQRLRVQPLGRPPQLVDADGDGNLDLVVITVRTDLLRGLTGPGNGVLETQLNVYRGDGRRFVLPAAVSQPLQLSASTGDRAPFVQVVPGAKGRPGELLLLDDKDLMLRPLHVDGTELALQPPSWRLPIGDDASVRLAGEGVPEVLVVADHEVLHVRWR